VGLTIGADPEIFLGVGGKFICAHGMIPGTKDQPFPVNRGAVQVDGVAVEFNIAPASSFKEFRTNLKTVQKELKSLLPGATQFLRRVTVPIDRKKVPEEALVIGCTSDIDAYTGEMNDSPPAESDFRSVGGHIHIGGFFEEGEREVSKYLKSLILCRLLDKNLGVYSLLWDRDTERRKLYGKAGACRLKSFGVEYRTLSNAWLFQPKLVQFVYDQVLLSFQELAAGVDVSTDYYSSIINSGDFNNEFFKNNKVALQLRNYLERN
jgi:hypothetical protein